MLSRSQYLLSNLVQKMKLTSKARKDLPKKDFAGPGRSFPIEDKKHARAAMMDAGHKPKAEREKIDAKARKVLKGK